jgi:hypothetical protein
MRIPRSRTNDENAPTKHACPQAVAEPYAVRAPASFTKLHESMAVKGRSGREQAGASVGLGRSGLLS